MDLSTATPQLVCHRLVLRHQKQIAEAENSRLRKQIDRFLGLSVDELHIDRIYTIKGELSHDELEDLLTGPLVDPVLESAHWDRELESEGWWALEVAYKPGVTDAEGSAAQGTLALSTALGSFAEGSVSYSMRYRFRGDLQRDDVLRIGRELLANALIQDLTISEPQLASSVESISLELSDDALLDLSRNRLLALNLTEMLAIRKYYADPKVTELRSKHGLGYEPTDVEIEVLGQTWSEHCKHKIFNAKIHYSNSEGSVTIDSLFNSCIRAATEKVAHERDWMVSVFSDNAGVIRFNDSIDIAVKVETHNSPSALDPYGGALTGILGVNRDIMGVGIGARLMANMNVLCFASPEYKGTLPDRLLHPRRVFEGVRQGIEHGGNKMGVPTVNGALVFNERYLGKPLVYCGSVGTMPRELHGQSTSHKEIVAGDLIVIAGGRTGRDGIHGATFSSEELHESSPTSAVQIGDPFTQKKLHDMLLEARDLGLYRTVTDNGAGGFASSIGELAELSGGCEIHLDRARLKHGGLKPWEILVSESQERMTFAVPPHNLEALTKLAQQHEVELDSLGIFTDSGLFHVFYQGETVALMEMTFLHEGVPQLELEAVWESQSDAELPTKQRSSHLDDLLQILSNENVCSRESVIRQYDHEVQGGSALKSLVGPEELGPSDAAVICPLECMEQGYIKEAVVIANGICPGYSDYDTYAMATCAIDEAVRNAVCVGADPSHIAVLDNFCWPDPIYNETKTPDGKYKLAQLVRACQGLHDYAVALGTPFISGKDSMKNDYKIGDVKISVPPTLLVTAVGRLPDLSRTTSMDVKSPGDDVYVLGVTRPELAGGILAAIYGWGGGYVPTVEFEVSRALYEGVHKAINAGVVASCHDCSDGGLAVALAESAFGGNLGIEADLGAIESEGITDNTELLFSESAGRLVVTVSERHREEFENLLGASPVIRVGKVREDSMFRLCGIDHSVVIETDINVLKTAWGRDL